MRISEKLMAKYKNMNLTRKMLLVYFAFAGVFLIVSVSAFQISMEAFEKRLYENSLHELDYYVQDVRDSLADVETRSREMATDSDIQDTAIHLAEIGPGTLEYSQTLTELRWQLVYENTEESEINGERYSDPFGNSVESAGCAWSVAEDEVERFLQLP